MSDVTSPGVDANLNISTSLGSDVDGEGIGPADQAEIDNVKKWLARIKVVTKHDESRLKQYAADRAYARGDSSFKVKVPIIGTFIDILVSFIVARDPDIDAFPSEAAGPDRLEDARALGKTLSIVIKQLWRKSKMKRKARRWVRSALTVGIGWLKLSWQEEFDRDPNSQANVRTLQDNLVAIQAKQAEIASGACSNIELARQELQELIDGAIPTLEKLIYNGLGIAFIRADNIRCSLDCESVVDCETGSWMAERWYMPLDEAEVKYHGIIPKVELKAAASWTPKQPASKEERATSAEISDISVNDADYFKTGSTEGGQFICGYEIWDGERNLIGDVIEGVTRFASKFAAPNVATTRFYGYFPLAFCEVDGERHPDSLVQRSAPLQDEYQRTRTNFATHRARVKPKLVFDATKLTVAAVKSLQKGTTAEMIGIKLVGGTKADTDLQKLLFPVAYPSVDMGLYDTTYIKGDIELVWGIQEALAGNITVPKTATESEISSSGTQARNSDKRDMVEYQLTEMAIYTAECACLKLSDEEVRVLAGPEALWVPVTNIDELEQLVVLEIRAGSTGKPNTAARQQAWSAILPTLVSNIQLIGQLNQSNPFEIADCLSQVVEETFERTGDRIDPQRFIPEPDPAYKALLDQQKAQAMAQEQALAEAEGSLPPGGPPNPGAVEGERPLGDNGLGNGPPPGGTEVSPAALPQSL